MRSLLQSGTAHPGSTNTAMPSVRRQLGFGCTPP